MFAAVKFIHANIIKIVPQKWILNFTKSVNNNEIFFCYWCNNFEKNPQFLKQLYSSSKSLNETDEGVYKIVLLKHFGKKNNFKKTYISIKFLNLYTFSITYFIMELM